MTEDKEKDNMKVISDISSRGIFMLQTDSQSGLLDKELFGQTLRERNASISSYEDDSSMIHALKRQSTQGGFMNNFETIFVNDEKSKNSSDSIEVIADLSSSKDKLSTLDSEYLKQHLGTILTLALRDIAVNRPIDPIHYLAHWLFKWRWNQQHESKKKDELRALIAERKVIAVRMKEEARIAEEKRLKQESKDIGKQTVEDLFSMVDKVIENKEFVAKPKVQMSEAENLAYEATDVFGDYEVKI